MTLRSVIARATAALLLAAAGIAALVVVLQQQEREQHVLAARASAPLPPVPRTDLPPVGRTAQPVLVCSAASELPDGAAPLLRVLADGSVAMVRPAPLAQRPGQLAETVPTVLLPAPLHDLTPAQRGGLLECLAALVVDRPVPEGAVRVSGPEAGALELDRLLAWLP